MLEEHHAQLSNWLRIPNQLTEIINMIIYVKNMKIKDGVQLQELKLRGLMVSQLEPDPAHL